ncbi:hypothetical protein AB4Z50_25745 [Paenibacillus sp. 2TAB26]
MEIDEIVKLIGAMSNEEFEILVKHLKVDPNMYILVDFLEEIKKN